MKNKMNCGCCDPEQTKVCSICGSSGCTTTAEDNKLIIDQEHPDAALLGFTSSGRLFADFFLSTSEASFSAVFDYADDSNYYAVTVSIDQSVSQNTQVILRITLMQLAVYSVIEERYAYLGVNTDVTAHTGHLCVSWSPSGVFANVEWNENEGNSIESTKTAEFNSGRAAFFTNDSILEDFGYFRAPGDVTDEGVCPACDVSAPVSCDCCPNGFALAWELDFSAAVINNEGWVDCDQIPGIYILDRVPNACVAEHEQFYTGEYIDSGCTGGSYKTTVVFAVSVGINEGECYINLTMSVLPDPTQPCAYTGIYATYIKRFTTAEDGCSGTHVLTKVFDRFPSFGFGSPCSGSLPATVTVTSIA